jgi:uncharacterized membrane protein
VIPLLVEIAATLVARVWLAWPDAVRVGLAIMFLFTSTAHFSSMKRDLAAMMPPPLTGAMWLIYLTGVFEIAGAIGLLVPRLIRPAAWALIAMLVAMFPANVYAALKGVALRGRPATALWLRTPLQAFWIAALWWSSVA